MESSGVLRGLASFFEAVVLKQKAKKGKETHPCCDEVSQSESNTAKTKAEKNFHGLFEKLKEG